MPQGIHDCFFLLLRALRNNRILRLRFIVAVTDIKTAFAYHLRYVAVTDIKTAFAYHSFAYHLRYIRG